MSAPMNPMASTPAYSKLAGSSSTWFVGSTSQLQRALGSMVRPSKPMATFAAHTASPLGWLLRDHPATASEGVTGAIGILAPKVQKVL